MESYSVSAGTYGEELCISPTNDNNFADNIEFTLSDSNFKTYPESLIAQRGEKEVCGRIGTEVTTQLATYQVKFI